MEILALSLVQVCLQINELVHPGKQSLEIISALRLPFCSGSEK